MKCEWNWNTATKNKRFQFLQDNFLIFLDTPLQEANISKSIICEFFGIGVLVFFQEKFYLFTRVSYKKDR